MSLGWELVIFGAFIPVAVFATLLALFRKERQWFRQELSYFWFMVSGWLIFPIVLPFLDPMSTSISGYFRREMYLYSCIACTFGVALAAMRLDVSPKRGAITLLTLSGVALVIFLIYLIDDFIGI